MKKQGKFISMSVHIMHRATKYLTKKRSLNRFHVRTPLRTTMRLYLGLKIKIHLKRCLDNYLVTREFHPKVRTPHSYILNKIKRLYYKHIDTNFIRLQIPFFMVLDHISLVRKEKNILMAKSLTINTQELAWTHKHGCLLVLL